MSDQLAFRTWVHKDRVNLPEFDLFLKPRREQHLILLGVLNGMRNSIIGTGYLVEDLSSKKVVQDDIALIKIIFL